MLVVLYLLHSCFVWFVCFVLFYKGYWLSAFALFVCGLFISLVLAGSCLFAARFWMLLLLVFVDFVGLSGCLYCCLLRTCLVCLGNSVGLMFLRFEFELEFAVGLWYAFMVTYLLAVFISCGSFLYTFGCLLWLVMVVDRLC